MPERGAQLGCDWGKTEKNANHPSIGQEDSQLKASNFKRNVSSNQMSLPFLSLSRSLSVALALSDDDEGKKYTNRCEYGVAKFDGSMDGRRQRLGHATIIGTSVDGNFEVWKRGAVWKKCDVQAHYEKVQVEFLSGLG